jgi:peptidylprolyl isomerase
MHRALLLTCCTLAVASTTAATHADAQEPPATPAPSSPIAPAVPPAPSAVAAPPADAERTGSGVAFKVLVQGDGSRRPGPSDIVTLHYTGWTTDGKAFDSTAARGRPSTVAVDRVMKGMSEVIQLMTVGEKRRVWIPETLAFAGQAGRPKGMVVLEMELLGKRTASGLAYRVIRPGAGTEHPTSRSRVTVHYTGWTTDGKMFDSSVARNRPATFGLDQVIKGWTEGVQLMVPGEKTRFWIPERLAYQGQQGAPRGMLVFDIELISIEK